MRITCTILRLIYIFVYSLTESATEPMKEQLVQIEANIKEFMEMIDASRTKILQNSEKILKMLAEQ